MKETGLINNFYFKICLLLVGVALLAWNLAFAASFYSIGNGATVRVYAHNVCYDVKNSSGISPLMIPTGTATDWSTFRSKKPSGVTLTNCSLVGGKSFTQCTNAGGTVVNSGANYFCRFNRAACLAGWTQYGNWSTTTQKTCAGRCRSGTTTNHAWSNKARESVLFHQDHDDWDCHDMNGAYRCYANVTQVGCY